MWQLADICQVAVTGFGLTIYRMTQEKTRKGVALARFQSL